jgi:hypothetical protein
LAEDESVQLLDRRMLRIGKELSALKEVHDMPSRVRTHRKAKGAGDQVYRFADLSLAPNDKSTSTPPDKADAEQ